MKRIWTLFAVACVGGETPPTATEADCERIHTEWQGIYDELVSNTTCLVDEDCHAPYAACSVGFGGCQVALPTHITQDDIDAVVQGYSDEAQAVECEPTQAICDCYGGYTATCGDGTCVLAGPYYTR